MTLEAVDTAEAAEAVERVDALVEGKDKQIAELKAKVKELAMAVANYKQALGREMIENGMLRAEIVQGMKDDV